MLEMLLDKKLLFVLMGILTGLGVADKCIVSMTMKRMVAAAGSMSKSNHPLMRLVRAKFEHACMISDTVENVGVFVDKYLYEYKVCGLRLHTLQRMEKICSGLLIVTGLAGAGITYRVYGMGDAVLRTGAVGCGLGILVWLFHLTTDENYCMQMAKNYMVDYLENVCLHKYEKVNQKERAGRMHAVNEMTGDGEWEADVQKDETQKNELQRNDVQRSDARKNEIQRNDAQRNDAQRNEPQRDELQKIRTAEARTVESGVPENEQGSMGEAQGAEVMETRDTENRASEAEHSVVRMQRENRRKERAKGTARNLARASARLASAEESGSKGVENPITKNVQDDEVADQKSQTQTDQDFTEELPKDEMIRQILREFMA